MYFVIIFMYYLPLVGFLFRMVAPNSKRPMMIILHQAGYQTKDIVKLLKISRTTVQKTVKRSKEIGSVADRSGRSRKRSARMEQNKKKLRDMIRRNSRRSIRKMVKKLKINEKSIGIIIRKDLGLNSYRIQKKSTNSQTKLYQTDLKDTDSFPKGFLRHATKRSFFRMRKYSQLNFSWIVKMITSCPQTSLLPIPMTNWSEDVLILSQSLFGRLPPIMESPPSCSSPRTPRSTPKPIKSYLK